MYYKLTWRMAVEHLSFIATQTPSSPLGGPNSGSISSHHIFDTFKYVWSRFSLWTNNKSHPHPNMSVGQNARQQPSHTGIHFCIFMMWRWNTVVIANQTAVLRACSKGSKTIASWAHVNKVASLSILEGQCTPSFTLHMPHRHISPPLVVKDALNRWGGEGWRGELRRATKKTMEEEQAALSLTCSNLEL